MSYRNRVWLSTLVLWLSLASLEAQVVTGAIVGRVTDTTGGVVPGATIQIQNAETGFSRTLPTDRQGRYVARNLPVGSYSVTVQQAGFRTEVRRGIVLAVGPGKMMDGGGLLPMEVAVGDKVLFTKYGPTEVKVDGKELLVLNMSDILGKIEG